MSAKLTQAMLHQSITGHRFPASCRFCIASLKISAENIGTGIDGFASISDRGASGCSAENITFGTSNWAPMHLARSFCCLPKFPAPTKAASASGSPVSLEASRPRRSSRVGRWRISTTTPPYPPAPTWRGRVNSSSADVPADVTVNANLNLHVNATGDLGFVIPSLCIRNAGAWRPGVGVHVGRLWRRRHQPGGDLVRRAHGPFGSTVPFARSDTINDTTWGFGDLITDVPIEMERRRQQLHDLSSPATSRLALTNPRACRIWASDTARSTPAAATPISIRRPATNSPACSASPTISSIKSTQYQNGVDMHFDWGASQFLSKQVMVGLVGYVYKELGCDSGSGDRVGCFQSQVVGVGPQIGFLFPVGDMQGYLNFKAYGEFDAASRPSGWNTWLTFSISPPAPGAPPTTKPIVRKY